MEENEMLEQTNETENVETETTEEIMDEGIELTDTTDTEEVVEEKQEEQRKTLKELLRENPDYQEELNGIVKARLGRQEREHQRELSKYKDTENVLAATIGGSNIEEINNNLRNAYKEQNVELPDVYTPGLTTREVEILADAEANEFINGYDDDLVNEVDRLANIGVDKMTPRDKIIFTKLAEERKRREDKKSLESIGIDINIINSDNEFQEFAKDLNDKLSLKEKYERFLKYKPKKQNEIIGSMKNNNADNSKVKDFYTFEEANKFTKADFDKNPELFKAVCNSMTKWK